MSVRIAFGVTSRVCRAAIKPLIAPRRWPIAARRRLPTGTNPSFQQAHRDAIYSRHQIKERLSLVDQQGGRFMALNLYRYGHAVRNCRPRMSTRSRRVARSILACVKKTPRDHLGQREERLQPGRGCGKRQLLSLCPALTPRELDTCIGLAAGHDLRRYCGQPRTCR